LKTASKFFLVAIALLVIALPQLRADSKDWTLQDMQGEKFTLSENLGDSPVIMLFWATWCSPCKKELDDYRKMFDEYQEKGVKVIAISEDNQKSQAKVKPYIESKGYTWKILFDPDGSLLKRYGGTSIPYSVVLDKTGSPQMKNQGAIKDQKKLADKLDALMGSGQ
jgi:cytochrome c biogenesis protein CcmG, thiol:disulfide interchange protein DsbE